ncbi:MAG TPA: hypothetical protein VM100_02305 [Longimicrobiales bacterium]|nr:hypothetical protein [Longimicrobiales bacterium]
MTVNLEKLSIGDLARLSESIHRCGAASRSLEECGSRVVRSFFETLIDSRRQRACALVRFFKTMPLHALPRELGDVALANAGGVALHQNTRCLVLLGTSGEESQWNSRHQSRGHQVIPLVSPEAVKRSPMISQLFTQLGINVQDVLQPSDEVILDMQERTYNVFHIIDAYGSPYIPAQDEFVHKYNVRSVVGFGGVLPSGDVFATILFAKCYIRSDRAELFRMLAVSMKTALLPFDFERTFALEQMP